MCRSRQPPPAFVGCPWSATCRRQVPLAECSLRCGITACPPWALRLPIDHNTPAFYISALCTKYQAGGCNIAMRPCRPCCQSILRHFAARDSNFGMFPGSSHPGHHVQLCLPQSQPTASDYGAGEEPACHAMPCMQRLPDMRCNHKEPCDTAGWMEETVVTIVEP